MQLKDLVKPIDQMTDDELMARLREVRHSRETVRPAAKKHVERAEKKESRKSAVKLQDLLAGLSDEDKVKLLEQLEAGDGQS